MADIEIKRSHNMGLKAARAAADRMAEHLGKRFGLSGDWDGNVLKFARTGVNGSLEVDERDLLLSVSLGFLLRAMKPSIEMAVRQELDQLFAAKAAAPAAKPAPKAPAPKPAAKSKKAAPRPKK